MAEMVGYRFHPTDEELINHYLMNKMFGNETEVQDVINEINVYRFDPWDLPCFSNIQSDDQVWYFFSPMDNKYNRMTKNGYWKLTGRYRKIKVAGRSHEVIGTKKTLVFYKGRVPNGERTSWVMHEYHPSVIPPNSRAYVVCKLKDKACGKTSISSCGEGEPSHPPTSDPGNHAVIEETPVESVCDSGGLDFDLGLNWNELVEVISLLDLPCPTDFSLNHNSQRSQFDSISENQEVVNAPESADLQEFVNSILVDQDDYPSVYPENGSDTDFKIVHPWSVQEISSSADEGPAISRECEQLLKQESSLNSKDFELHYQSKFMNIAAEECPPAISREREKLLQQDSSLNSKSFKLHCQPKEECPPVEGKLLQLEASKDKVRRIQNVCGELEDVNFFYTRWDFSTWILIQTSFSSNQANKNLPSTLELANLNTNPTSSASFHDNVRKQTYFKIDSCYQNDQETRQEKPQNWVLMLTYPRKNLLKRRLRKNGASLSLRKQLRHSASSNFNASCSIIHHKYFKEELCLFSAKDLEMSHKTIPFISCLFS